LEKIIGVLFPVAYKAFNEQNGLSFMDDVPDSYRSIGKIIILMYISGWSNQ
jgi:hypothetical protein